MMMIITTSFLSSFYAYFLILLQDKSYPLPLSMVRYLNLSPLEIAMLYSTVSPLSSLTIRCTKRTGESTEISNNSASFYPATTACIVSSVSERVIP